MGAKVTVPTQGGIIEGELVEFQEREPGKWLEYYLPDEKKWLRVKPVLVRVVKIQVPSRTGEPFSYVLNTASESRHISRQVVAIPFTKSGHC